MKVMIENKILEKQLLIRSLQEPSLTKQVLAQNVPVLLQDEADRTLAYVMIRYYNESSIPMSEELFKSRVSDRLTHDSEKNVRLGKSEITDEQYVSILNRAGELIEAKPDPSEEMAEDLDKYVKDKLTAQAIIEEAQRGTDNLAPRVAKRTQAISELNIKGNVAKPISVLTDFDLKREIYEQENKKGRVSFGFEPFDDITGGGLKRGEVGLVGGDSGNGKSQIMTNLSYYYALKGHHNVLHITLEENASNQLVRFDRILSGASMSDVYQDKKVTKNFIDKTNEFLKNSISKNNPGMLRYIYSMPNTLTVDDVRQMIISTERETGKHVDVVMLDYADLLKKDSKVISNESIAGEILFQDLSKLAKEQDLVIFTGTQLNRSSTDKDTKVKTLHSIEGSYRKINTIALGVTINSSPQEFNKGFVRLYLDKIRTHYKDTDDNCLYLKYNTKNMKLVEETPEEKISHQSLLGKDSKPDIDVKKDGRNQSMGDAINKSIDDMSMDTLNKAFS